jgi:hypothetical protein
MSYRRLDAPENIPALYESALALRNSKLSDRILSAHSKKYAVDRIRPRACMRTTASPETGGIR